MPNLKDIIKQKLEAIGFDKISFTEKGKLEGYEFLLSLYFPRTLRTLYFYRENDSTENIIVEFVDMPQEWKGVRIYMSELDEFIKYFIVTSNALDSVSEGPLASWAREKTNENLELADRSCHVFKYFMGYYNFDTYSDLHRSFIFSPFVTNHCFNEAAGEDKIWGSAQYRTWYSASVINYEGYAISKKKMLYYVSGCYLPSKFNKSRIIGKVVNDCVAFVSKEAPIDIVGAFDTIGFPQFFSPEALLNGVLLKDVKNWKVPLEALYFLLKPQALFKKYFSLILKSPNIKIRNAVAERAILRKDAELAKKALKKGISKQMEEKLKANNLI